MDISKSKSKDTSRGISGSPKKGGGGGKGTWGKGGLDDLITDKISSKDPNYNSEDEEEEVVLHDIPVLLPELPELRILREFFIEADNDEVAAQLKESKVNPVDFVRRAVYYAMDHQPYERELVSKLLSHLYGNVITSDQYVQGFESALDKLDDHILDIPLADEMLGKFIARAIVDEIMPPAFLKTSSFADTKLTNNAAAIASNLINDPHRSRKLEHIWGPGDLLSVKRLKLEVQHLIQEYLTTGDKAEADRCVRKLNAPNFHSQLVRYAIRGAIECKTDADRGKIIELLAFLSKVGLLSTDHVNRGFKQFSEQVEDVILDVPSAKVIFEDLVQRAQACGLLSADYK